jgi:ABC-2 type transport system ATP-binding protein
VIECSGLAKTFRIHRKAPGLKGSLAGLVRRDWQDKVALRDVSLRVAEGEIIGLVGANGAGKTTLVKILAGIVHPSGGEARVLGYTPHERKSAFRRQISLIMGQKAQLWWDLPAADCFLLLREIYRLPRGRFDANVAALAAALDVEALLTTPIRRLSLGERMKMELVAALLHDPRVVYLDEPTIGLDLTAQRAIRDFLRGYLQRERPAMILTSHYMEDIERLCERIVVLRHGEVVYDGSLAAVVARYAGHKTIVARTSAASLPAWATKDADLAAHAPGLPVGAAVVAAVEGAVVRVRVAASVVADVAGWVLRQMSIADLAIESEEAATIIEAMIRGQTP